MKKRAPLRSNIEASRPPGRPCGLLYPTPCPHQRQTAADRGFVHFEVSRHVRCAQALHRPQQRQHGQLTSTNPERCERVVEKARKDAIEHSGAATHTPAEDLSCHLTVCVTAWRVACSIVHLAGLYKLVVSATLCGCTCISLRKGNGKDGAQDNGCKYNSQGFIGIKGCFSLLSIRRCDGFSTGADVLTRQATAS